MHRLWSWPPDAVTIWAWLWCALAAVTVALLILMRTRWGQSRPLEKCAFLSLLAHVLLAGVAMSLQRSFSGHLLGVRNAAYDSPIEVAGVTLEPSDAAERGSEPTEPWDEFIDRASAAIEPPDVARATTDRADELIRPASVSDLLSRPRLDASLTPPSLAEVHSGEPEPRDNRPKRTAAEPIEQPAREQGSTADAVGAASSPERMAASDEGESRPAIGSDIPRPTTNVVSPSGAPNVPSEHDDSAATPRGSPAKLADSRASGGWTGTATPLPSSTDSKRPAKTPEVYQLRGAPNRMELAQRYGATRDTEAAVRAALVWLAANQSPDGRWKVADLEGGREDRTLGHDRQGAGIGADTGITGLAVLAFLGAGETHLKGNHRDTVRRGLEFLINSQREDGNLAGEARLFAKMYCHAMASFAVSEAYALTGDRRLEACVRAAIAHSVQSQHPGTGGWRYQPGDSGDMSQHGWQVLALKSAELAGIPMPDTSRRRAIKFVESCASGQHNGLSSYRPNERASRTMTAEALVCRRFLTMNQSDRLLEEAQYLVLGELPGKSPPNFYYWYYATLALHPQQDQAWTTWNEALRATLCRQQRGDGRFAGSWDPDSVWGGYGGRAFSTSLGALCLEVYYRFLPTFGRESGTIETADR